MAVSALSRRLSEVVGVALFALSLIWLIALVSYSASDPVWFFNTGSDLPPTNFAGRIGAFMAELSFQLVGYSAYLAPIVVAVVGWHYFWCRILDAPYTKAFGAALLCSCTASFLALAFGSVDVAGKEFRAGGYMGTALAGFLAEYLNRTGSIILILTLLFLALILSTQFSFGRLFGAIASMLGDQWAALIGAVRARRDERQREKQRREVLRKHLEKQKGDGKGALAGAGGRDGRSDPDVTAAAARAVKA
ncbi:MAG: DNA translocase FtsK 4TM domain-containing protein, partial [Vicinamibacterales bacterium]